MCIVVSDDFEKLTDPLGRTLKFLRDIAQIAAGRGDSGVAVQRSVRWIAGTDLWR
jgi:hypothetical protein